MTEARLPIVKYIAIDGRLDCILFRMNVQWDLLFYSMWLFELHRVRVSRVLAYHYSPEPPF